MEIIAIEFDRARFNSPAACAMWMRSSGSSDLLTLVDRRSLKLKSGNCIFMSEEKRKVWGWYGQLWREKGFVSERLDTHVVLIRGDPKGGGYWDASQVPAPLPATQEKRQKLELQQQRRDFKRQEAAEKLKDKRKREAKKRKELSASTPDGKDAKIPAKKPRVSKKDLIAKGMTARPISPIFNLPVGISLDDTPSIQAALKELNDDDDQERPGHPNPLLDSNL